MKRIFELTTKDIESLSKKELKQIIATSEGRTVVSETIVSYTPYIREVSNLELAASFGADMITLNTFNFNAPFIWGVHPEIDAMQGVGELARKLEKQIADNLVDTDYIRKLKKMVGRLIGVNLEPVPEGSTYEPGYCLSRANLERALAYGFDYVVLTGNPNTGVTHETICEGIKLAKEVLGEEVLIIAGKMHGAGSGNLYDVACVKDFVEWGADIVLFPAPGTVPGFDLELAKQMTNRIHEAGALAMTTIGTSQEGSSERVIEQMALLSKMAGADIQHIGDCGTFGMALPENIKTLSIAIRGIRHTYRRMAQSILR